MIDAAIRAIPQGEARSDRDLRLELAASHGAEDTCPLCTGIFWRVAAEAAEEDRAEGRPDITPWWRITRGGLANAKMPGGAVEHARRAAEEGVVLTLPRSGKTKS
jgi:hypothetical protein